LFRGLAQRTKGRKTSYFDAPSGRKRVENPSPFGQPTARISRLEIPRCAVTPPVVFQTVSDGTKPFSEGDETSLKQSEGTSGTNRRRQRRREAPMNHSIHSADRATHLKIVVMALVAGIAVAGFAISARTNTDYSQTARVIKAGKPVVLTSSDTSVVR
jgi:hypothetical protein